MELKMNAMLPWIIGQDGKNFRTIIELMIIYLILSIIRMKLQGLLEISHHKKNYLKSILKETVLILAKMIKRKVVAKKK